VDTIDTVRALLPTLDEQPADGADPMSGDGEPAAGS
jgi:hypothetical protein